MHVVVTNIILIVASGLCVEDLVWTKIDFLYDTLQGQSTGVSTRVPVYMAVPYYVAQ